MPARVIVYCRKPALDVTAQELRDELDIADLYTLAEALDLPEGEWEAVNAMRPHLKVDEDLTVHWKPDGRPIQIDFVDGSMARGEIEELQGELPASDAPGAARVRKHLEETVQIVHFELGIPDSNHLGATLTEVLAFHIAARFDGLVWFYYREWASPDDRGATVWAT